MIDFVKVDIRGCNIEQLRANKRLDFKRKISESTGELDNKRIAEFHHMELHVFDSGYIQLTGSLHKAYNSLARVQSPQQSRKMKGFNGNQFNYTQLRFVVLRLTELIGFDPNKSILRNLEFGVNLEMGFDIPLILCNLMRHRGKPFNTVLTYYCQAVHNQYKVKCYFKSYQYKMPENVLRFELQFKRIIKVNNLGIIAVSDMLDRPKLDKLKNALIESWDEVILYDYTIEETNLEPKYMKWINRFKNTNFWNIETEPNRIDRPKKKLKHITENHSKMIQEQIGTMIGENWNGLSVHCETYNTLFSEMCNSSPFSYTVNAYTKP